MHLGFKLVSLIKPETTSASVLNLALMGLGAAALSQGSYNNKTLFQAFLVHILHISSDVYSHHIQTVLCLLLCSGPPHPITPKGQLF